MELYKEIVKEREREKERERGGGGAERERERICVPLSKSHGKQHLVTVLVSASVERPSNRQQNQTNEGQNEGMAPIREHIREHKQFYANQRTGVGERVRGGAGEVVVTEPEGPMRTQQIREKDSQHAPCMHVGHQEKGCRPRDTALLL